MIIISDTSPINYLVLDKELLKYIELNDNMINQEVSLWKV
jgi:hypothetical protein